MPSFWVFDVGADFEEWAGGTGAGFDFGGEPVHAVEAFGFDASSEGLAFDGFVPVYAVGFVVFARDVGSVFAADFDDFVDFHGLPFVMWVGFRVRRRSGGGQWSRFFSKQR